MSKVFKTVLIIVLIFSGQSLAQRNSVKNGVGLILGTPNVGISIKFLNSGYRHFNGAVAWSSGNDNNKNNNDNGYLHLHADYIFNKWRISGRTPTNFDIFLGAGLQLRTGNHETFGVRIPVGISYTFNEVPLDAFIELVPRIGLIPDTDFNIDAAFAIRFLF
jgi:hypothetical protein